MPEVTVLRPFMNKMKQNAKVCQDGVKCLYQCSEDLKNLRAKIRSKSGSHDDRLSVIDAGGKLLDSLAEDVLHSIALSEAIEDETQAETHSATLEKYVPELNSCKDGVIEISTKMKSYLQSL